MGLELGRKPPKVEVSLKQRDQLSHQGSGGLVCLPAARPQAEPKLSTEAPVAAPSVPMYTVRRLPKTYPPPPPLSMRPGWPGDPQPVPTTSAHGRDPRSRYVDVLGQEWKNSPVTKCAAVPNCPAQRPAVQSGPAAEPFIVRAKTSGEGWLGFCRKKGALLPEDSSKSIVWDPMLNRWVDMSVPQEESKPLPRPSPIGMHPTPPIGNTGYLGDSGSLPKGINIPAAGLWSDPNPQLNPDGNITEALSLSGKPGPQLFVTDMYALMAPMEVPSDDSENSAWWNGNLS
eukprot:XP_013987005.1 PREDICTED: protein transport protein Sec16A-like [Salmo salar]